MTARTARRTDSAIASGSRRRARGRFSTVETTASNTISSITSPAAFFSGMPTRSTSGSSASSPLSVSGIARDPQLGQRLYVGRKNALAAGPAVQILQRKGFALGVAQGAVAIDPSRGGEQLAGLAQVVAQAGRRVGRRRLWHLLGEDLGGKLCPERLEHLELVGP